MCNNVSVIIGLGGIGKAIARQEEIGRTLLLADACYETLVAEAEGMRRDGHQVQIQHVDITSRQSVTTLATKAFALGKVSRVIHTAGVSPLSATIDTILKVDLYGVALVLEEFQKVIAHGASALVVSSMIGHMNQSLSRQHEIEIINTAIDNLLELPFLRNEAFSDAMDAYAFVKRINLLQVQIAAVRWGARGARVNSISPGLVATQSTNDELNSVLGETYRDLINISPANRMSSPDEIASAADFLLSPRSAFVTGTDLLIDGGVVAAMTVNSKIPRQQD
jgi:NAD(P)-dependent dehydrogenase (short-subunit alcohol dehydrogenase family)